jgi:hypothetical protein
MIAARKYSLVVGDSERKMEKCVSNLRRRKVIKIIIHFIRNLIFYLQFNCEERLLEFNVAVIRNMQFIFMWLTVTTSL